MQSSMEFPWSSAKVSGQVQEQQESGLRVLVGDRQDAVMGMKVNCQAAKGRKVIIPIHLLLWNVSSGIMSGFGHISVRERGDKHE